MRADRLLSIVLLLQVHRRLTARDLGRRLEVSERTILRDMEALSIAGVPVVADRGNGGGWRLVDGYQTRLTGLTESEVQSLFLPRSERIMADLGLRREGEAAILKLQAALPEASRRDAEIIRRRIHIDPSGWRDPAESVACLPVLLAALWQDRRVRFLYHRVNCEPSGRIVDPLGLVAKGAVWYLVARSEGESRTYRVSRIEAPELLEESAAPAPPDFDLAAHWVKSAADFREQLPRYYATFLAEPGVMRWVRYRGWRLEEETAEAGRTRIRLRFDAAEEARQFALGFGAAIEVVEPVELREAVLAAALEIVRRSERAASAGG